MASASANTIIQRALVKLRVIRPGEAIPPGKAVQVYNELLDMLEQWSLDKLMLVADTLESFAMTIGQEEYTYGAGGDFNSVRPIGIRNETYILQGSTSYGVELKGLGLYRRISSKTTGSRPRIMAYNPEFPLGKVFLWPRPTSEDSIHFRVAGAVTGFVDRTTSVAFEPGVRGAIIANLAMKVASSFGKKVSRELRNEAGDSKDLIKSVNASPIKPVRASDLRSMLQGR